MRLRYVDVVQFVQEDIPWVEVADTAARTSAAGQAARDIDPDVVAEASASPVLVAVQPVIWMEYFAVLACIVRLEAVETTAVAAVTVMMVGCLASSTGLLRETDSDTCRIFPVAWRIYVNFSGSPLVGECRRCSLSSPG